MNRPIRFLHEHIWGALPATVSPAARRWGSALWGGGLVLLGIWLAWRRLRLGEPGGLAPWISAGVGLALAVALLIPTVGPAVYLHLLRVFAVVGFVVSHLLLTVVFYLVVTPMGWLLKLLGNDPLALRPDARPRWHSHRGQPERRRYYRLF